MLARPIQSIFVHGDTKSERAFPSPVARRWGVEILASFLGLFFRNDEERHGRCHYRRPDFRRRSAAARKILRASGRGGYAYLPDPRPRPEYSHGLGSHGHGYGSAPGDRHGPPRGPRVRPP